MDGDQIQSDPSTTPDSTNSPQASLETAVPEIPRDEDSSGQVAPEVEAPSGTLAPEVLQLELAPEAPSGAVEAPRESENLEGVNNAFGGENGGNNDNNENSKIVEAPPSDPNPQGTADGQGTAGQVSAPVGFIRELLARANAKIQFNKQRKLEKIIQLAQAKVVVTNDDVEKLLKVSDATATRYLVKLVGQGRLVRVGSPKDAKYQLVR